MQVETVFPTVGRHADARGAHRARRGGRPGPRRAHDLRDLRDERRDAPGGPRPRRRGLRRAHPRPLRPRLRAGALRGRDDARDGHRPRRGDGRPRGRPALARRPPRGRRHPARRDRLLHGRQLRPAARPHRAVQGQRAVLRQAARHAAVVPGRGQLRRARRAGCAAQPRSSPPTSRRSACRTTSRCTPTRATPSSRARRGSRASVVRRTPIHAEYHEASAQDAYRRVVAFFREHLAAS